MAQAAPARQAYPAVDREGSKPEWRVAFSNNNNTLYEHNLTVDRRVAKWYMHALNEAYATVRKQSYDIYKKKKIITDTFLGKNVSIFEWFLFDDNIII